MLRFLSFIWPFICYLLGHNIELLRKQEKNSRKPSEDLAMYSQKALPCFAEKIKNVIGIEMTDSLFG